jgi:hypothetical protein
VPTREPIGDATREARLLAACAPESPIDVRAHAARVAEAVDAARTPAPELNMQICMGEAEQTLALDLEPA